ncbi:MAG: c-type cytochrome, partial [Acetobacteraceae bacterium]
VGTAYGRVAAAKLGLLAVLLGFAAVNRYRLAPALRRTAPDAARRRLVRSIAVQTGFGLAAVLAAGLLSELPPSLHEQPLWPFAFRPSLVTMAEPELAAEVWTGIAWGAAAACLLAGLAWGRLRRGPGLVLLPAAAAVLAWFAQPHLSLLLVEAYPTSYYASPTNFAATSIMRGAGLYPANCASCHGDSGRGDGPAAASLAVPPADLTAAHLWEHADGEMFWWLTHGIPAPDGTPAMPGFAAVLSPDQRWTLIDAVRARNAGTAQRETGEWPRPVAAPEFPLACPGQDQATPETMRGRVLYLVAGLPGAGLPADDPALTTVLLTRGKPAPGWTGCVASDPAAWDALALLTGQTPDGFRGTRLLVDAEGWLRTVKRPGAAGAWNDPATLRTDVQTLRDHPLAAVAGGHHH